MVTVWRLRENIIRTALCWVVWHNVHSQQYTYMNSSYRSSRLGLSHWDPYAVRRGGCLELYYCTGFLQCFDTVGLVMWPVEIVPEMTYNLLSGTLSLYTTYLHTCERRKIRWRYMTRDGKRTGKPGHCQLRWMLLLLPLTTTMTSTMT